MRIKGKEPLKFLGEPMIQNGKELQELKSNWTQVHSQVILNNKAHIITFTLHDWKLWLWYQNYDYGINYLLKF